MDFDAQTSDEDRFVSRPRTVCVVNDRTTAGATLDELVASRVRPFEIQSDVQFPKHAIEMTDADWAEHPSDVHVRVNDNQTRADIYIGSADKTRLTLVQESGAYAGSVIPTGILPVYCVFGMELGAAGTLTSETGAPEFIMTCETDADAEDMIEKYADAYIEEQYGSMAAFVKQGGTLTISSLEDATDDVIGDVGMVARIILPTADRGTGKRTRAVEFYFASALVTVHESVAEESDLTEEYEKAFTAEDVQREAPLRGNGSRVNALLNA